MKKTNGNEAALSSERQARIIVDGRLRMAALGLSGLLAGGGIAIYFVRPEQGAQVWATIGPLIACVVTTSLSARRGSAGQLDS